MTIDRFDVLGFAGLVLATIGAYGIAGVWFCLLVVGVFLTALAVAGARNGSGNK